MKGNFLVVFVPTLRGRKNTIEHIEETHEHLPTMKTHLNQGTRKTGTSGSDEPKSGHFCRGWIVVSLRLNYDQLWSIPVIVS